jgi:hypothetical protein
MKKMEIITSRVVDVGGFAERQREFLEFHRTNMPLKGKAEECPKLELSVSRGQELLRKTA